jgi:hypothetical protein
MAVLEGLDHGSIVPCHVTQVKPMQRLRIMWHMTYYGVSRSWVAEHFVVARSTLYVSHPD